MSAPTARERAHAAIKEAGGVCQCSTTTHTNLCWAMTEAFVAAQRDERERCAVAVDEFVGVKNNTVSAMLRALPEEPTP